MPVSLLLALFLLNMTPNSPTSTAWGSTPVEPVHNCAQSQQNQSNSIQIQFNSNSTHNTKFTAHLVHKQISFIFCETTP